MCAFQSSCGDAVQDNDIKEYNFLCAFQVCGDAVQDNDIKEYKHQLKAERRARKAAESWLRSELKSRVCL